MKGEDQEVRFQCPKCPKQYTTKYNLKAQMNASHDGVKRYQCYFCSLAICTESVLIRHMQNHTAEKPYKCQYCRQWYKKKESVKKHKGGQSCHLKLTYPLLTLCYFCRQSFPTHGYLNLHMKIVHLKEEFKQCILCDKFFCSNAINRHIRTVHLLQRKHKCQLCFKRFCRSTDLNRHIQSVHTKEKYFKCYFCSKSFVDFGDLKKHTWIHTKEKPLTCYFCRKDFSVISELSAHIGSIHTRERPFKCTQCPSHYYATKSNLNLHVRKKHGIPAHQ